MIMRVPGEFLPPEDRAQFAVNVELPTGTSLEATKKYVEVVAQDLRKNGPGVTGTFITVGGGAQGQVNIGQIQVLLTPRTKRSFHQEDAMAWVRSRYKGAKGALFSANAISPVGGDSAFKQQPIQFNIRGRDMAEIEKAAAGDGGRAEQGQGHRRPGSQLPQRQARTVVRHRSRPGGRSGRAGGGHRHHAARAGGRRQGDRARSRAWTSSTSRCSCRRRRRRGWPRSATSPCAPPPGR